MTEHVAYGGAGGHRVGGGERGLRGGLAEVHRDLAELGADRITRYALQALRGEVQAVLDSGPHDHNNTLFHAAIRLGQLVGAGMLPKLAAIADALEGGVEAVQVIDGRVPHSVLVEIFTEAGIGTKITACSTSCSSNGRRLR